MLVVLAIWMAVGLLIWRDRTETLHSAERLTMSLTNSVAERVEASLRGVEVMLQDVAGRVDAPGKLDEGELVQFMLNRAAAFGEVRSVLVMNADGVVRFSSNVSLRGADFSQRGYFKTLKAANGPHPPILSEPLFNATLGRVSVVMARPLLGKKGGFDGVVAAALDPDYFREMLGGTLSEDVDRLVIANAKGDVLARLPDQEGGGVTSIRSGPLFTDFLPKARSGTFIATSAFDGRSRLASYKASEHYPVVVSVGVTIERVLRRWTFNALAIGAAGAVFSLLVVLIAAQLDRRLRAERQAILSLAASEERYRQLIENQMDLIHHYLPDTTLLFFNRAYAAFYDRNPESLTGQRWIDFVPEAERADILSSLADMTPANPTREDRRQEVMAGQPERWVEWRTTAQFDEAGRITGFHGVGRDVTDAVLAQRATTEREELYRQIFHHNPAVKLLVDPRDGRIVDANPSAAQFYGYPLDELKSMVISQINTLPVERIENEMAAVAREDRLFLRFVHRLASGELRDVEVYASPLHVGGRSYLSSIVVDVTARNRFEAELAAKTAELERSNADLEQFAYVASHDLRQPLRMVSSYVTLLQRSLADKLSATEVEFMSFAVDGAKHMEKLILGLLEYSRAGRGQDACEPVDLNQVAAAAAANLGVTSDPGVTLTVATLPTISGVGGELTRLFQNLMGNALKYRHPERNLCLDIGCRREASEWVIWVEDNGMGIDPKFFDRIFQMFQRLHAESEIEGSGIGLAICRKIVRSHGGRIWVESEPGQGSRFYVAFPAV